MPPHPPADSPTNPRTTPALAIVAATAIYLNSDLREIRRGAGGAPGQSEQDRQRADAAGLTAFDDLSELLDHADVVFSICPPHAALQVVLQLMRRLGVVVVPVALALMATALLVPAVDWLDRRGAPRAGAVALLLLTDLAVVGGLLTFVVSQFVTGLPGLIDQVTETIGTRIRLITGPLGSSRDQINQAWPT